MRREYLVLAKFAAVAAVVILLFLPSPIWSGSPVDNIAMAVAYLCGTALSAVAGKIGIHGGDPLQRPHRRGCPEGHQAGVSDRASAAAR